MNRRGDGDPVSIADALARVGADIGLPATDALGTLTARWVEVVGVDVATHVRLVAVRDATLAVIADSPLWGSQLRYLEAEIVDRANALVGPGTVRGIRVRVDPG